MPPSPPTQPETGPGGADYVYDDVIASAYREDGSLFHEEGNSVPHFWLFEPANPRPGTRSVDSPLPLVLFIHGCCLEGGSIGPKYERRWIDHLVLSGAVLAYPMHRSTSKTVREATAAALAELAAGNHTPVDLNQVAVVGYSIGGPLALDLTAASPEGLPAPAALLVLAPDSWPGTELGTIPAATRVILVELEDDQWIPAPFLEDWRIALAPVPAERRTFVTLRSDDHGVPALVADHYAGFTEGELFGSVLVVDALDWYGTWKLLDALMACAFDGEFCEYAFGDTPEVRFMGTWSDGVPVKEALVITDVATPEATPAG